MAHPAAGLMVPGWLWRGVIGTGASLLITGASWLAVKAVRVATEHETRISVIEEHNKSIDKSLEEIKEGQQEQARDTKEILKRLPRR